MSSRLSKYIQHLSLRDAIKLYRHIKTKKTAPLNISFLRYPVFIRGIMSDELMFEQMFIAKDYDVDYQFIPTNIIDLGANVGYASLFFINKFPAAKIFAVEPDLQNYKLAKINCEPYHNIQVINGAVWYQQAELNIVDKGLGEAAFMIEEGTLSNNVVKAFTIPDIMVKMNIQKIDLLKMDIEGSEKELFENGYDEWLPKTKMLIVETHDRYKKGCSKALFKAIGQYDFSLELKGENLIFYNNDFL